jgi:gluconolactonase
MSVLLAKTYHRRAAMWAASVVAVALSSLPASAQRPAPPPQAAIDGVVAAGAKLEPLKGDVLQADVPVPPQVRAATFRNQPLRAPGDAVRDRKGGVYFTDQGQRTPEGSYVLYRRPGGEVILIDNEFISPSGLALSPDEQTLYAVDLNAEHVYAFDVQPDGSVTNRRRFARLEGYTQPATSLPRSGADGITIDARGRLYVTTDTGVQVIGPNGGHLGTIRVPAKPRNAAFAAPGSRDLLVATAMGVYRISLLTEGPK